MDWNFRFGVRCKGRPSAAVIGNHRRRAKAKPLGLRGINLMRHMAVCLGLIATATQGEAMAAHSAYVIWYLRGNGNDGEPFLMSDGIGVGYGARHSPTATTPSIAG